MICCILILTSFHVFSQQKDVDIINASPDHDLKNKSLINYKLKGNVEAVINLVHEPIEKFGKISKPEFDVRNLIL